MLSSVNANRKNPDLWCNIGTVVADSRSRTSDMHIKWHVSLGVTLLRLPNLAHYNPRLPSWVQPSRHSVWRDVLFWTKENSSSIQYGVLSCVDFRGFNSLETSSVYFESTSILLAVGIVWA